LKLAGNSVQDVRCLHTLKQLKMLDISNNHVTELTDTVWVALSCLQVLLVHDNRIDHLAGLVGLVSSKSLLHVTLRGNPISKLKEYRRQVFRRLPQLLVLDEFIISDSEQLPCGSSTSTSDPRLSLAATVEHAISYSTIYQATFASIHSGKSDLRELRAHILTAITLRRKSSPAVLIQAVFRGYFSRKPKSDIFKLASKLQSVARGWAFRHALKKEEMKLLNQIAPNLINGSRNIHEAATRIQKFWVSKNVQLHFWSNAKRIQRWFRNRSLDLDFRVNSLRDVWDSNGVLLQFPLDDGCVLEVLRYCIKRALVIEHHASASEVIPERFFCKSNFLAVGTSTFKLTRDSTRVRLESEIRHEEAIDEKIKEVHEKLKDANASILDSQQLSDWNRELQIELDAIRKNIEKLVNRKSSTTVHNLKNYSDLKIRRRIAGYTKTIKPYQKSNVNSECHCTFEIRMPTIRCLARALRIIDFMLRKYRILKSIKVHRYKHAVETASASVLQCTWRGYYSRSTFDITTKILTQRAAVCIQRCWRVIGLKSRLNFISALHQYLDTLRSSLHGKSDLYIEEHLLRIVRKMKGREMLRHRQSLFSAQERPSASACGFDFTNTLRWIPTDSNVYVTTPSSSRCVKDQSTGPECTEDEGQGRVRLRVGIPRWLLQSMGLEMDEVDSKIQNTDLGRIITRGAVLTSGELVIPAAGEAVGVSSYFQKISLARRLGDEEDIVTQGMEGVSTGVVLVKLKYADNREALTRAAFCFTRSWQQRTRQCMPLLTDVMMFNSYSSVYNQGLPWGKVPTTFTVVLEKVIAQHEAIEEAAAIRTVMSDSSNCIEPKFEFEFSKLDQVVVVPQIRNATQSSNSSVSSEARPLNLRRNAAQFSSQNFLGTDLVSNLAVAELTRSLRLKATIASLQVSKRPTGVLIPVMLHSGEKVNEIGLMNHTNEPINQEQVAIDGERKLLEENTTDSLSENMQVAHVVHEERKWLNSHREYNKKKEVHHPEVPSKQPVFLHQFELGCEASDGSRTLSIEDDSAHDAVSINGDNASEEESHCYRDRMYVEQVECPQEVPFVRAHRPTDAMLVSRQESVAKRRNEQLEKSCSRKAKFEMGLNQSIRSLNVSVVQKNHRRMKEKKDLETSRKFQIQKSNSKWQKEEIRLKREEERILQKEIQNEGKFFAESQRRNIEKKEEIRLSKIRLMKKCNLHLQNVVREWRQEEL